MQQRGDQKTAHRRLPFSTVLLLARESLLTANFMAVEWLPLTTNEAASNSLPWKLILHLVLLIQPAGGLEEDIPPAAGLLCFFLFMGSYNCLDQPQTESIFRQLPWTCIRRCFNSWEWKWVPLKLSSFTKFMINLSIQNFIPLLVSSDLNPFFVPSGLNPVLTEH